MTARNDLLTVEEAAHRMAMSARHVRRLVSQRRIAHHKLGRSVRLDPADIDTYIAGGRVEPISATDAWRDVRQR